jgi:hypothetical protein
MVGSAKFLPRKTFPFGTLPYHFFSVPCHLELLKLFVNTSRPSMFRAKAIRLEVSCLCIETGPLNKGTPELGGQEGQPLPLPFTRRGMGAKVPFQFKGLPWRNSELSEMLVQFFYEFASENARNAVIELQE